MKLTYILEIVAIFSCLFFAFGVPSNISSTYNAIIDVQYGAHYRHKMDIYSPKNATKDTPMVLFIHGGGWTAGDKSKIRTYGSDILSFVEMGYTVVAMNHRFVPESDYLDMVEDLSIAVLYLYDNSTKYNITTDSMAIAAFSSGSHLAMLYSYGDFFEKPIDIALLMDFVGPTDFTDSNYINNDKAMTFTAQRLILNLLTDTVLDNEANELWQEASPINYVNYNAPPTIMGYGQEDILVSYTNGLNLEKALDSYGIYNELFLFPNSGHNLDKDPSQMNAMIDQCRVALSIYLPV